MLTKCYSVYDKIACTFGPLFQANNDNVAQRNFSNLMIQQYTQNPHTFIPSDFELYYVGSFDNETGVMSGSDKKLISTGSVPEIKE